MSFFLYYSLGVLDVLDQYRRLPFFFSIMRLLDFTLAVAANLVIEVTGAPFVANPAPPPLTNRLLPRMQSSAKGSKPRKSTEENSGRDYYRLDNPTDQSGQPSFQQYQPVIDRSRHLPGLTENYIFSSGQMDPDQMGAYPASNPHQLVLNTPYGQEGRGYTGYAESMDDPVYRALPVEALEFSPLSGGYANLGNDPSSGEGYANLENDPTYFPPPAKPPNHPSYGEGGQSFPEYAKPGGDPHPAGRRPTTISNEEVSDLEETKAIYRRYYHAIEYNLPISEELMRLVHNARKKLARHKIDLNTIV